MHVARRTGTCHRSSEIGHHSESEDLKTVKISQQKTLNEKNYSAIKFIQKDKLDVYFDIEYT